MTSVACDSRLFSALVFGFCELDYNQLFMASHATITITKTTITRLIGIIFLPSFLVLRPFGLFLFLLPLYSY